MKLNDGKKEVQCHCKLCKCKNSSKKPRFNVQMIL